MKFLRTFMIAPLSILVLSACSGDPAERRQANYRFDYIDSELTSGWKIEPDAQPQFYPMYNIPVGQYFGEMGSDVDIRPPQQVFNLIPGSRVDSYYNGVLIWVVNPEQLDQVWDMVHVLTEVKKIPVKSDEAGRLETDWVDARASEDADLIEGRYQIDRIEQDGRYAIYVSLIDWKEKGEEVEMTPSIQNRYSAIMANQITTHYDKQLQEEARLRALQESNTVPVMMGRDTSGLPIIIARSEYEIVWTRLEQALPLMGFTVLHKNQSQGQFDTDYYEKSIEEWDAFGLTPLDWDNGDYNFLIGDLENRSSINVTDRSGRPISEDKLQQLIPILEILLDNSSL